MEKRGFIFAIFIIITIAQVLALTIENNVPVQIQTVDASGNIVTGTFEFTINVSNSSTCSPVLYSNVTTKTTDVRGIVSYNLENVSLGFDEQYWFCYYRDGVLKETRKIGRTPYSFRTKNITLSGIEIDSNLNLGNYNFTIGGGWLNNGVSIIDGGIYAQVGYFYNITSLNVTKQNLTIIEDFYALGNVGIGTTAPDRKLHIKQSSDTFAGGLALERTTGSTNEWEIATGADNRLYFGYNGAVTGIDFSSAGGVIRATSLITTGNVGIGTTSPNEKLTVDGNVNITGNITLGQKITFALGEIIDNIVDGWITITGSLNVTNNLEVENNLSLGDGIIRFNDSSKRYDYYNGSIWKDMSMGNVPAGAIMAFNSATCPTGWILADGNSETPDLRGIFIRGAGQSGSYQDAAGNYYNATYGEYQNDSFQAWQLGVTGYYAYMANANNYNTIGGASNFAPFYASTTAQSTGGWRAMNDGTHGTPRTGNETRPANIALIYCMKTTEDSETSNTIWATSGDDVVLNNASKNVVIASNLSVNGETLLQWQKIEDPPTGWFANKTSGWTADSFSGGLEVDFSSVVPAGTKAVRIAVYFDGATGILYYRKSGDTNISNTPHVNNEMSHRFMSIISSTYMINVGVVWLSDDYKAQFAVTSTSNNLYVAYPIEVYAPIGSI